ncbi:tetratricopeptide repeat protein [Oculatella sp. LEGE 06141]|nr:tetratricopeptide repeat protein [Oculatella sp. LEGE 06141]
MRVAPRWQIVWSGLLGLSLIMSPLVMSVGLMAAPAIAQSVPSSIRRAYTLMDQGLVNQAIALFERALRQYPQSPEGRLGLAIAYRRAGRDADALQAYERTLEVDPNNRLALISIGVLGGYRPEWQVRGIAALDTVLAIAPNDMEARIQRATLYRYQGRFEEAIADYNLALQANPSADTVLGAAQAYAYGGYYQQGLELFNRYAQLTRNPIEGAAAIPYAIALQERGNSAQAVQILETELRRTPAINGTTIRMRAALAVAYAASGLSDQANSVLQPLRGRQDSRMILARSLNQLWRYSGNPAFAEEAIALYRQVLTRAPNLTIGIGREIADVLSGFPSEQATALNLYTQLVQQAPDDRGLQIQQAALGRELGVISKAEFLQRLQTALQPFPADPVQQRLVARSLTQLDSPDPELLPIYQTLLNADINEPLLNIRTAQIYIQQNELNAARNALAAYAATPEGRDPLIAQLLLAEIDRRDGNLDASAQRYEAIVASNPRDNGILTGALQGLAGVRQTQGRVGEAIAIYDQIILRNPQDVAKPLGRASLAYRAGLMSDTDAEAILNAWLASRPLTDTPPELFSLVGVLPASPQRDPLYSALLQADPNNVPIQLRQVQVIAARNPNQAKELVNQLVARNPDNLNAYFVQGQLAQDLGDLRLAGQSYERILDRFPNNTDALTALGGVRFQQRRLDAAAQLYQDVLAIEPTNPTAQTALIGLTAAQGRRLDALQQLEQLQFQHTATGVQDEALSRQIQEIQEGFLQQRGFQPPWERY